MCPPVAHETSPEYLGRGTCDACDAGSESTPVKVWRVRTFYGPETVEHHLCKSCLVKHGHEAPTPKTAEDVP